jgi:hypothetical protein
MVQNVLIISIRIHVNHNILLETVLTKQIKLSISLHFYFLAPFLLELNSHPIQLYLFPTMTFALTSFFNPEELNIILTSICTQYVQMNPMAKVATTPNARPAFLKAIGIAKMPDPKLPLSRWIKVSRSLQTKK